MDEDKKKLLELLTLIVENRNVTTITVTIKPNQTEKNSTTKVNAKDK